MQLVPNIVAILDGMKAAKRLYDIIDHKPTIDVDNFSGIKKDRLEGNIVF